MTWRTVDTCRACGGGNLHTVLDLGVVPLANDFLEPAQAALPEDRFPLKLLHCRACGLGTLDAVVPPERMFRHYLYVTGTSSTMRDHFGAHARTQRERFKLDGKLVGEIGSNDGTLLKAFGPGVRVLGVEPAVNLAQLARTAGVPTVAEFFGAALGASLRRDHGEAACILANNVVAHVDDLVGLLQGVHAWLAPDGVFIMEAPHILPMVDHCEFDTIYHEHLSYLSLHSLQAAARRAGMDVVDVEQLPVHGGSLRVFMAHAGQPAAPSVAALMEQERVWGLLSGAPLAAFAARVQHICRRLPELLRERKALGRTVVGYGAAAKANTLLCAAGMDARLLKHVVDRNPLKQGRLTPGSHIPVVGMPVLEAEPDVDILVLAWNLLGEIQAQLAPQAKAGARFLVPIPEPRLL